VGVSVWVGETSKVTEGVGVDVVVGVGVGVSESVGVGVGSKPQIGYEVPVYVTVVGVTPVIKTVAVAVGSHINTLLRVSADCAPVFIVKLNS
jgi:hypothetical protein